MYNDSSPWRKSLTCCAITVVAGGSIHAGSVVPIVVSIVDEVAGVDGNADIVVQAVVCESVGHAVAVDCCCCCVVVHVVDGNACQGVDVVDDLQSNRHRGISLSA